GVARGSRDVAARWTRGSAGAQAGAPYLFRGPLLRPLGVRVVVLVVDRVVGREELDQGFDLESVRLQHTDPVAVPHLEPDLVRLVPLPPLETQLKGLEP